MPSRESLEAIATARFDAARMHRRYDVRGPEDIRVDAWAHDHGIEIVEADLDGASAQLVRLGDVVQIVLPSRVPESAVRRFSLAHELYHFLRRHPSPTTKMMCRPRAGRGDETLQVHEVGSNAYAGALLLPEFLLRKRCEVCPVNLDEPWRIARDYDVSLLTSAIRFTELSSERCAAVFSRRGRVVWVASSPTFTPHIARGALIARESVAWDFFERGRLDEREQPVPASAWFGTSDVDIIEHSTCSPAHGTVLSMLWAPESVASELRLS